MATPTGTAAPKTAAPKGTRSAKSTTPAKAARAISLHIGLNAVSAEAYSGWSGPLAACEFDAHDMAAIARAAGMKPTTLLTKKATRKASLAAMRAAAKKLVAGDLFLLTYSGHGGQVPDVSGDEPDKQDETWCLYDGQLIDDELYAELARFGKGVRVLVLSDSCHSGTVTRAAMPPPVAANANERPKLMPPAVAMRVYREHRAFYDGLQAALARAAGGKPVVDPDAALAHVAASGRLQATVANFAPVAILISGCQDNQTSMDGEHNGAFTEALLKTWNEGAFRGGYARFHQKIRALLPPTQSPNLFVLGRAARFLAQRPFTV